MKNLKVDLTHAGVGSENLKEYRERVPEIMESLSSGKLDFTGWVLLPEKYDREELANIKRVANKIKAQSKLLIVIGIGGSYLGARAVLEALEYTSARKGGCVVRVANANANADVDAPSGDAVRVLFAGNNLSSPYHQKIICELENNETSLCVISKSGTTTEPAIAFAILKDALIKKYGEEEANKRIYVITDKEKGTLREEASRKGYESFIVPDDIGGRYSVLSPVGLLPLAAAGIDVEKMLEGAANMSKEMFAEAASLVDYTAIRMFLSQKRGKAIEIFEYYEPHLQYFAEWLKQLFGESEGKEGKGIFPASLSFSADLHSMGQFLQEGNQIFFETLLDVEDPGTDIEVPSSAGDLLAGLSLNQVNRAAARGVIAAHKKDGIPVIRIVIPSLDEYCMGQMIYFFEMNCAIGGILSGVDPFNQPGVESYKREMKAELKNIR